MPNFLFQVDSQPCQISGMLLALRQMPAAQGFTAGNCITDRTCGSARLRCVAMRNAGIECVLVSMQAVVTKHTNIRDVLALFFRDDIIAWSARRSGRHASAGAGIKPAQLRSLVQMNVERTFERLREVSLHASAYMAALAAYTATLAKVSGHLWHWRLNCKQSRMPVLMSMLWCVPSSQGHRYSMAAYMLALGPDRSRHRCL